MDYRRVQIHCVGCALPMVEQRSDAGHAYDRCDACGGVFVEADRFLAMLREAQPRFALEELPEHNDGTARRPCPRCGERMSIVWLEYLQLEQCPDHGVWFDPGELDRALRGDTRRDDRVWLVPRDRKKQ